jgi:hypothetical protein
MLTASVALNIALVVLLVSMVRRHVITLKVMHTTATEDLVSAKDELLHLVDELRQHYKAKP